MPLKIALYASCLIAVTSDDELILMLEPLWVVNVLDNVDKT